MQRSLTVSLIGALLVSGTVPARAQTDGYLLACSAAAQLGRGCTTLSGTSDPSTLLTNPAGLVNSPARSLSLSGAAFLPTMDYTNAINPTTAGKDNVFPLPAVSYAARGGARWGFGAAVQTLGGMGADYTLTHALLGPGQRYHSKFGLMKGGAALAYRLNSALSLGATAGALYGQVELATPYAENPAELAGLAGLGADPAYAPLMAGFTEATAYANMSGLKGFGPTGSLSLEYRASPRVSMALMWTAPSTLTMGGGTAGMDMNAQFGQLYQGMVAAKGGDTATVNAQLASFGINMANGMASTFDAEVDFGIPQTVTFALGLRPADRWILGVDVGYIGWKRAFRQMPVRLTNGSNGNINIMVNADPTDGGFASAWPLQWKDAWTARLGAEYLVNSTWTLRGGLIHGSNPVSRAGLFTIFPAIAQNTATGGVGFRMGRTLVDVTYARTFRSAETAAATHIVATEYANSRSQMAETTVSCGFGWKF